MARSPLKIVNPVTLNDATMLLALGGWMDGGSVSTGTVRHLMRDRKTIPFATIDPAGFYIETFPGSMELAALLRPHVIYEKGLIKAFEMPANEAHVDVEGKLLYFVGKEPNLNWTSFADQVFAMAKAAGVTRIIFMGSFGGSVPHTREPRLYGAVSEEKLLPVLKQYGLKPTEYEGPASFATYLLARARSEGIEMLSISVEIPNYLEGTNPISIEAVTRRLASLLNLNVDLSQLRQASAEWEAQVSDAVAKDKKLAKTISRLQDEYDNELVESMDE